jgi:hypothetical protein
MSTDAADLITVANRLKAKEGTDRAVSRLMGAACLLLFMAGVKVEELNARLATAIRDFDEHDDGARH